MSKRKVVLHVFQSLSVGGAESQLTHYLRHTDKTKLDHHILAFGALGPLYDIFHGELNIPINEFEKTLPIAKNQPVPENRDSISDMIAQYAKHLNADVILARTTGILYTEKVAYLRKPVIWRLGDERKISDYAHEPHKQVLLKRAGAVSDRVPSNIVCNSQTIVDIFVESNGFKPDRMMVVPSGVDEERFKPNPIARAEVRKELGISEETPVIGIIARYDPKKDYPTFFAAAEELHKRRPDVRFIVAGKGQNPTPEQEKYIHFVGVRTDIHNIAAALDVGTSSSVFEAPGQTLIEMSACGVPLVVTDVKDMRDIVEKAGTGTVVPCKRPDLLANAWEQMLDRVAKDKDGIAERTRANIIKEYSVKNMAKTYDDLCLNAQVIGISRSSVK